MTPEVYAHWMASRTKHGGYRGGKEAPEHYIWRAMVSRCGNSNSKDYPRYGGRGITVCDRWLSYENFIADMGCRPAGLSIDRIDNNGSYEPANCRWADLGTQQKNKSSTKVYVTDGFEGTLVECASRVGISKELAHWRWNQWGTFEKGVIWQQKKAV